jgi:putative hydrolase of the HAD superfamily
MSAGWDTAHDDGGLDGDHPIEAVFFDFGGVFIASPFAAAARAARDLGVPEAELLELVFGPYDQDGDHPWHRLERGELSFDDATAEIADRSVAGGRGRIEPLDVLMGMASDREPRGFMVELVRALRAGDVRTSIITNNIREFGAAWRAMIPVDELFDDVVDSCEVGVRKPDPAIYRLACERLGVEPERALFVDDHQGNVVGARAIGMGAIWCGHTAETTSAAADAIRARALGGR